MPRIDVVRSNTEHLLDGALKVLDKLILLIPDDKLEFSPVAEVMTAKQLAYHIYQTLYILTRSTSLGSFKLEHLDGIPFDPNQVKTGADIVVYGTRVKDYVRGILPDFREEDLDRMLHEDWGMTGFRAMNIAFEEALHHRGQLVTYLRILGIKTPYLYDYS